MGSLQKEGVEGESEEGKHRHPTGRGEKAAGDQIQEVSSGSGSTLYLTQAGGRAGSPEFRGIEGGRAESEAGAPQLAANRAE